MNSNEKWDFKGNNKYRKLVRHLAREDILDDDEPFFTPQYEGRFQDWGYSLFLVGFSSYLFHSFLQKQSEKKANEWIGSGSAHFVPSPFNIVGLDNKRTFLGLNLKPELVGEEDFLQPVQKFYSLRGEKTDLTRLNPYFYFHYAMNRSLKAFKGVEEFHDIAKVFLGRSDAQVMAKMIGTSHGQLIDLSPRLFEPYFGGENEDSFKLTSELLDSFFTIYSHCKLGFEVHIPNTKLEGNPFNSYELDGVIFDPYNDKLVILETTFESDIGHLDNKLTTYLAFKNTDIDNLDYVLIQFNEMSGSMEKESTICQSLSDKSFHVIKPDPSLTRVQESYLAGEKIQDPEELQGSLKRSFESVVMQLDSTLGQIAD